MDFKEELAALKAEIEQFKNNPNADLVIIRRVEIKKAQPRIGRDGNTKQPATPLTDFAYAAVWINQNEGRAVQQELGTLAELGIIAAISSPYYQNLAQQNRQQARLFVKPFTRHNDKLGFDYSVPQRSFVASYSPQFVESGYGGERGLLQKAQDFYSQFQGNSDLKKLSEHFAKMITMYKMKASDAVTYRQQLQHPDPDPTKDQYARTIQGLTQQLEEKDHMFTELEEINRRLEHTYYETRAKAEQYEKEKLEGDLKIRAYDNKTVLEANQVKEYPRVFRKKVTQILEALSDGDEKQYIKTILEPFHPHASGARVPQAVPRETMTYTSFHEHSFHLQSTDSRCAYISNFDVMTSNRAVFLNGSTATALVQNAPVSIELSQVVAGNASHDEYQRRVDVIPLGVDIEELFDQMTLFRDNTIQTAFHKARVVGAGTRVFKTSAADNESGILDQVYARDGASFDDNAPISTELARPRSDRMRTYLSQCTSGCIRGKNGFISQISKRPHDEASLRLHDVNRTYNSDANTFTLADIVQPVWFVDLTTGVAIAPDRLDSLPSTSDSKNPVGVVLESLQQRHSILQIFSGCQPNMTFSVESIYRIEGIADQSNYGFATYSAAKLKHPTSALVLLQSMDAENLFSPYSARREYLLRSVFDPHISGIWDETIFPAMKDLIRYGADSLVKSNTLQDMVDAVVDSSAATLGIMAPEFMPAILAAKNAVSEPLGNLAERAVLAARDWAIKGHDPQGTLPHSDKRMLLPELSLPAESRIGQVMIDTTGKPSQEHTGTR